MKIINFVPFLSAVIWLLSWWWLTQNPKSFLLIDFILMMFFLFAAIGICAKAKEKKWWNAALLPIISNVIALGYLTILSSPVLIGLIVVLLVVLNYTYWRFVYFYYNAPGRYTSFSLENLSFYVNFLSVFFLGALAFGLRSFLQYDFWLVLVGVAVISAAILYQAMWASKINWRQYGWHFFVYWLVLLEFFGVLNLLPFNHSLLGFLWASIYYLLLVLFNDLINRRFNRRRLFLYGTLVLFSWVILLLTATWL